MAAIVLDEYYASRSFLKSSDILCYSAKFHTFITFWTSCPLSSVLLLHLKSQLILYMRTETCRSVRPWSVGEHDHTIEQHDIYLYPSMYHFTGIPHVPFCTCNMKIYVHHGSCTLRSVDSLILFFYIF